MVTWDEMSNHVIHQVRSICPTCTVQYRIQYSTVQYSTVQYRIQHSTVYLPYLGPHVPLEAGDERVAGEVSVGVVRALDQSEGSMGSRDPPPSTTAHLVRVLAVAAVVVGGVDRHHDLGLPVDLSIEI